MKVYKITSSTNPNETITTTDLEEAKKIYIDICREAVKAALLDLHDPFDIIDEERQSLTSRKRIITRCIDGTKFELGLEEIEE